MVNPGSMTAEIFRDLEEGDKILFNDRKVPLKVEEVKQDRVLVKGSQGGEYQIYLSEDDDVLFSDRGSRRYASYCKELRRTGQWKEEDSRWRHSLSGAEITLEKNRIGYWEISVKGLETDVENPKYGYSDREEAEKDVQKIIRDNPEG